MVKLDRAFENHARWEALAKYHGESAASVRKNTDVDALDTDSELHVTPFGASLAQAVRARSILQRIPGVVAAPFAELPFLTGGTEADFVGEARAVPVRAGTFGTNITLHPRRVSGLVVVTTELLRHSEAEAILRRDMTDALATAIDRRLLDPASDDGSGTRPASITNGITAIDATGVDTAANAEELVADMLADLIEAGSTLEAACWVTTPTVALALHMLRTAGHQRAFEGVTPLGGVLAGLPLIVSASAPDEGLTLLDGGDLLVADRNRGNIGYSTEATIDQSDAPDGNRFVSLYQANAVGVLVSREISWQMREGRVVYAENVDLPVPELSS